MHRTPGKRLRLDTAPPCVSSLPSPISLKQHRLEPPPLPCWRDLCTTVTAHFRFRPCKDWGEGRGKADLTLPLPASCFPTKSPPSTFPPSPTKFQRLDSTFFPEGSGYQFWISFLESAPLPFILCLAISPLQRSSASRSSSSSKTSASKTSKETARKSGSFREDGAAAQPPTVTSASPRPITRGHPYEAECWKIKRKCFFGQRIDKPWNSLPREAMTATDLDMALKEDETT
uniref:uncharacterized protein LOC114602173 n=1 Tax=Podarcis muralis TaxID=64176 RepID=UPI00109F68BE|nr:uncharacterized protein LOC114602173 [Podarcis muralis]